MCFTYVVCPCEFLVFFWIWCASKSYFPLCPLIFWICSFMHFKDTTTACHSPCEFCLPKTLNDTPLLHWGLHQGPNPHQQQSLALFNTILIYQLFSWNIMGVFSECYDFIPNFPSNIEVYYLPQKCHSVAFWIFFLFLHFYKWKKAKQS